MAAAIMIFNKNNTPPKTLYTFFSTLDDYMDHQGFIKVDNLPRTYFINRQISPQIVRSAITTIKNTKDYSKVVANIYYSANLTKG